MLVDGVVSQSGRSESRHRPMAAALQLHPATFELRQPDANGLQEIVLFNHPTRSRFTGMSGPKKSGRSQGVSVAVVSEFQACEIPA